MLRGIIILLVCLCRAMTISAQDSIVYDNRSGLSHWIVSDVLQDRQGFIWLSTWNGLNRYDGYEFRQVKSRPGDGTDIASEVIRQLALDSLGNIVCLTAEGVFGLDLNDYSLHDLPEKIRNAIPNNSHPTSLRDRQGNLWQVVRYGVVKHCATSHPAMVVEGTESVQARAFLRDRQRRWWLATKEDECVRIYDEHNSLLGFLGGDGRLHREKTRFGYRAYCIMQTAAGDIWMGCKPGALLHLTPRSDGSFDVKRVFPQGMTCDVVYHIVEDKWGRLWMATYGGGVQCVVDPKAALPTCVPVACDDPTYRRGCHARRLAIANDGLLACATTNGLLTCRVDGGDVRKTTLRRWTRDGKRPGSLCNNFVMDVAADQRGRLFVATENGGIDMVEVRGILSGTPAFRHFSKDNSSLTSDACLAMTMKDDGHLFVVCTDRVVDFDPDRDETMTFSTHFWGAVCHFSEERPLLLYDGSWLVGQEQGAYIATPEDLGRREERPPLVFTSLDIEGQPADLGVCMRDTITLLAGQRNFSVSFAALDFTDNAGILYRSRLDDSPWSITGSDRTLTFYDMTPGQHMLTVQSTDRYGRWVDNERRLVICVVPRWYETLWARALAWLLVACMVAAGVYVYVYVRRLRRQRAELLEKYMALMQHEETSVHKDRDEGEETAVLRLSDDERRFLDRVMDYIETHLSDSDANIDDMAAYAAVSRSSLNRKLRSLMGITAAQLLIDARMRQAKALLEKGTATGIADVAYRCGYTDARYFSRCFKQKYGVTPTEALHAGA